MKINSRSYTDPSYSHRYGFNGMPEDNELKGEGNSEFMKYFYCDFVSLITIFGKKNMQLLVNISDNKADFVLELLNSFNFVQTKTISEPKYRLLDEISSAVQEVKSAKKSKIKMKKIEDFLNEL